MRTRESISCVSHAGVEQTGQEKALPFLTLLPLCSCPKLPQVSADGKPQPSEKRRELMGQRRGQCSEFSSFVLGATCALWRRWQKEGRSWLKQDPDLMGTRKLLDSRQEGVPGVSLNSSSFRKPSFRNSFMRPWGPQSLYSSTGTSLPPLTPKTTWWMRTGNQKKELALSLTQSSWSCRAQDYIQPPVEMGLGTKSGIGWCCGHLVSRHQCPSLEVRCVSSSPSSDLPSLPKAAMSPCHHAELDDLDLTCLLSHLFLT